MNMTNFLLIILTLVSIYIATVITIVLISVKEAEYYDDEESDGSTLEGYLGKPKQSSKPSSEVKMEKLIKNWQKDSEAISNMDESMAFQNLEDFLHYVHSHNLKVVDVANKKIRTIANLEKKNFNHQETVLITFDDDSKEIFKPHLFAKYI